MPAKIDEVALHGAAASPPEVFITGDPSAVWADANCINHPDQLAVTLVAVDGIFLGAGQPRVFEKMAAEGLEAHNVLRTFKIGCFQP